MFPEICKPLVLHDGISLPDATSYDNTCYNLKVVISYVICQKKILSIHCSLDLNVL